SIMVDYLHTTLLRQTRTMMTHLAGKISTADRALLDRVLTEQRFPYYFYRGVRGISNLAHVKGTEVRNLLLYSMIPTFILFFDPEQVSYISLFSCAIRLLYGPPLLHISRGARCNLASELMIEYMSLAEKAFGRTNLFETGLLLAL
ncbi:unnamed protein product, partial [Didymodactylos carnosus]